MKFLDNLANKLVARSVIKFNERAAAISQKAWNDRIKQYYEFNLHERQYWIGTVVPIKLFVDTKTVNEIFYGDAPAAVTFYAHPAKETTPCPVILVNESLFNNKKWLDAVVTHEIGHILQGIMDELTAQDEITSDIYAYKWGHGQDLLDYLKSLRLYHNLPWLTNASFHSVLKKRISTLETMLSFNKEQKEQDDSKYYPAWMDIKFSEMVPDRSIA